MTDETIDRRDALESFLKFADDMRDIWSHYQRPAYQETCTCGASVEIGRDLPNAERARMYRHWFSRHTHMSMGRGE